MTRRLGNGIWWFPNLHESRDSLLPSLHLVTSVFGGTKHILRDTQSKVSFCGNAPLNKKAPGIRETPGAFLN